MKNAEPWNEHVCRIGNEEPYNNGEPPAEDKILEYRRKIEPWLSAVVQAEHLSLLVGNGLPAAVATAGGVRPANMALASLEGPYADNINEHASRLAKKGSRGEANVEDQIRAAIMLAEGLAVLGNADEVTAVCDSISKVLAKLVEDILNSEKMLKDRIEVREDTEHEEKGLEVNRLLCSFLLSFASRAATRERLQIFTTNYDRLIEYGCDWVGLRVVDRFIGYLKPMFRSSRIDVDMHYNPPGIRGEPRYLEGVVKLTKLHGSLDWRFENGLVRRIGMPFGGTIQHNGTDNEECILIYPNAAKDVETTEYPYADLFRDFAASLCRPNAALVIYGYGFGDDHVNRVLRDMLTIPSTHIVIISYDDPGKSDDNPGRIERFCRNVGRDAQISLLIGKHFGDLATLVDHYLPKPAIDRITMRQARLKERRGEVHHRSPSESNDTQSGPAGDNQ